MEMTGLKEINILWLLICIVKLCYRQNLFNLQSTVYKCTNFIRTYLALSIVIISDNIIGVKWMNILICLSLITARWSIFTCLFTNFNSSCIDDQIIFFAYSSIGHLICIWSLCILYKIDSNPSSSFKDILILFLLSFIILF